jgi:quinol monooxygenase YgiN
MYVAELTLHAKPGHYQQVADQFSAFAERYLNEHEALHGVMVLGDEASGIVRGIGLYVDQASADRVNSDPEFATFNDELAPMLATPPERVELALLHLYNRPPS